MIPKIIHYCWFGGRPLPKSALKCINSWRKFFPDYEIKEWNESNFDVNMILYTAEAYKAKKYAFVSDFARFWILHERGGVYFDTDVEVIRSMDDILERGAFMGLESKINFAQEKFFVNPGLGCACEASHSIWSEVIETYRRFEHFDLEIQGTVCAITSQVLEKQGFHLQGEAIYTREINIYPPDYFCPQAMYGAPINITKNTHSIHHFDCTWLPWTTRLRLRLCTILPNSSLNIIRRAFHRY